ncbi:olfactory receptor 11A1-like [Girardinichthys multiradiatus]|uniref:olfactory receptor 11A1-like n=1 Tax=Girardinichthys multiradiatus TaxID=208333 RepID=UPI001FADE9EB|nr:olfactory receptor 11A1-like [Girardinichthys multiradiatus]
MFVYNIFMDGEVNETYITLEGHVELHKYKYLYFAVTLTVYIFIVISNLTIVYLIWMHTNLHEPMYIFIAALLLNSVVFSTNIYPKLLSDFLSEKQVISYPACYLQFFLFYCLGASEFSLLAAMAYDRYVSICKPLQYAAIMGRNTMSIYLSLAWLVPACLIAVMVILSANTKLCRLNINGILCNNSIYSLHCVDSKVQTVFGAVVLVMTLLFPMLFIVFTYTRIFIICYHSSKDVRKKAAQTCMPHLLVLISFSCLCAFDVIIVRLGSNFTKVVRLIMTLQAVLYHPLFNPIIYGLKMREISKQLTRLFSQVKVINH